MTPDPSNKEEGSTSSEESYQENAGVRRSQGSAADNTVCPQCGQADEEALWIQCDNQSCGMWYHVECTTIDLEEYDNLSAITWFCNDCKSY